MRARAESFGAWVRLDEPPALVAVDRALAARLGVDGGALWAGEVLGDPVAPLEVHVSVTARCGAGCKGCYLDATPGGEQPTLAAIKARLTEVARAGVFTVAIGGGEPLLRDDLADIAAYARSLGLAAVLTTSGFGMTEERAEQLASFAQVNVSYDGGPGDYDRVRGVPGAAAAERAIAMLAGRGVRVGVNVLLTRATFEGVERAVDRAVSLGAREVQLLRVKPAGRAVGLVYLDARLTAAQAREVVPLLGRLAARGDVVVRVDCSMLPFFSAHELSPSALARYGVMGCEAGRHLAAVTAGGAVAGCSFMAPSSLGADGLRRLGADAALAATRGHASRAPEPCQSCTLASICRGGCRVVASHLDHADAADPECPRVLASRSRC